MAELDTVRQAAAALADTANGIANAGTQRGLVLRLPVARDRWNTFAQAVAAAAGADAPPAPLAPRAADELDALTAESASLAEGTLTFWERALRLLSKQAQAKGFLVTYDVWSAPAPGATE